VAISTSRTFDIWNRVLLATALVIGVGLIVGAFTVPAYNGTVSPTLIQENGLGVLAPVSIPFVIALAVSVALLWRHRHRKHGAGVFAWTVTGLLCVFCFLGILTIGVFVLPVAILLIVVCARSQSQIPSLQPPTPVTSNPPGNLHAR
jgi:hypothetical protein